MAKILLGFSFDEKMGVCIRLPSVSTPEMMSDRMAYVGPWEKFGNIKFKDLKEAAGGCILWDTVTRKGEILKSEDPRWDALLGKSQDLSGDVSTLLDAAQAATEANRPPAEGRLPWFKKILSRLTNGS